MKTTKRNTGRTQRAFGLLVLILTFSAATALAQEASVIYLEGEPELRASGGATEWLDFGTVLTPGDSVVTGGNDFVELEQGAASTIRVNPDTVFTIREVEENGRRRQVMSNSTGSVGYRFNRLAGRDEPRIGTSSVVAGVRGTEVVVYAGANGSSLFLVESGLVDVTSAGQTVSLAQDEGVEVPAGGPPGEKFEIIGRAIDFSEWESEKQSEFAADPIAALEGVEQQLATYYGELQDLRTLYSDARELYDEKYAELSEAVETYGRESDEAELLREELTPLSNEATILAFNIRYYALTTLSLRRHVLGKMYVTMRSTNIMDRDNPEYRRFSEKYQAIIQRYEDQVTPELVAVDI